MNVFDAVVLAHLIRTLGVPDETELEEPVMHLLILCLCRHAGSSARLLALCGHPEGYTVTSTTFRRILPIQKQATYHIHIAW